MLAGVPPFVGPSQQVIQSRHLHEPPPDLGNIRPGLPAGLITAVTRALAKVPADRFHAADEFGRALESARLGRPRSRRRRRWPVVAALVLAALGGVWAYRGRGPALVEDRYLLLPFRGAATGPAVVPSADQVGRLLWRELSRWTGLDLVDEAAVQDQLSRDPRWGLSPEAARAMATALRAGRVIWGDLVTVGDSVEVRAGLYRADAPSQPIRRVQVTVPVGATGSAKALTDPMVTLARGLIAAEATLSDDIGRMATSSYPALLATLAGDSALLQWDLGSARAFYRRAIEADPNFGAPKLRYATASLWAAVPEAEWTSAAAAALAAADQLSPIERLEARALDALARADFPQACRAFDQVIAADSVRFNGWYGRGECLTRDDVVVPDRASPSGWRFRGSFAAGVAAHRMALRLVPYAHRALGGAAVDRLAARLMAGTNWLRVGRAAGASDPKYAAFLGYEGDSLGFTPYPIDQVLAGRRMPVSMARAVREARRSLLAITSGWIAEYPGSVAAVKAHAYALEVNGMVTGAPSQSALALIRTLGAGLPSDSVDFELGAWEVRLLLKARRYSAASQLAGRLLAMAGPAAASMAEPAASLRPGLAALIGRADLAAGWSEHLGQGPFVSLDGQVIDSPEGLLQTARRLLAYAAVGGPRDSLRAIEARLRREVTAQVEPSRQALVYETLRLQAAHLAYPDLDPPADTVLPMSRIEHALARGDRKAGLAEFERLAVSRAGQGAGGVAPEYLVLEARLLAMLGDSAAARSKLDGLLADLRVLNQDLLGWVPSAAAIGRGLGLRAALGGDMSLSGADTASQALWRRRGRE